jgi:hypothetical protein
MSDLDLPSSGHNLYTASMASLPAMSIQQQLAMLGNFVARNNASQLSEQTSH